MKLWHCMANGLFGPVRHMIKACGFGDARTQFYHLHGIQALHVSLER